MIVAGWVQLYRVHGLKLTSEAPISRAAIMGAPPNKIVVVATFSHEALEPVYAPPSPSYAFVGNETTVSAPTKNLAGPGESKYTSLGCWLLIEAMSSHEVSLELDAQFAEDPGQHSEAVLHELRGDLRLEMQPLADMACGAYATQLDASVFSLIVEGPAVWASDQRYTERSYQLELLAPAEIDERVLAEVSPRIEAGLRAPGDEPRALQIASHWFLRGRVELPGTLDHFAGMFLALEALVIGFTSGEPTPDDVRRLDALELLAREHDESLAVYVQRLRSSCAKPGLPERFRRLAERLFPEESDHSGDVELFRQLNRLRNLLIHPSRRYDDLTRQEAGRAAAATQLALRYLLTAFRRVDETQPTHAA